MTCNVLKRSQGQESKKSPSLNYWFFPSAVIHFLFIQSDVFLLFGKTDDEILSEGYNLWDLEQKHNPHIRLQREVTNNGKGNKEIETKSLTRKKVNQEINKRKNVVDNDKISVSRVGHKTSVG
jgi:hypothetical protein